MVSAGARVRRARRRAGSCSTSSASPRISLRHRGREEQVLALRRQRREDPPDVGQEAHVEHVVGLVEHQRLDAVERSSSRCCSRSSRRPGQATTISGSRAAARESACWIGDAAEDRRGLDLRELREQPDLGVDLGRQLARRREDQDARARGRAPRAGAARIGSAKAAVLPVPVWARPSTSRPSRPAGIVSTWIGRGSREAGGLDAAGQEGIEAEAVEVVCLGCVGDLTVEIGGKSLRISVRDGAGQISSPPHAYALLAHDAVLLAFKP